MKENSYIFESKFLEVASFENYKEATLLISVLDEPDAYGRIIPEESGETYHKTIIGYPLVCKLKRSITGIPNDFGGHERIITVDKNGNKKVSFDTIPIGSVMDAWIEEREVDGYDTEKKCILCKCKLWTSRFPEYFKVFDKLYEKGELKTSWEMTVFESEEDDDKHKILKVFEFIGQALLGKYKTPAVYGSGILEYAETEDDDELFNALEKDLLNNEIDNDVKEDMTLGRKKENEEPVVNVAENQLEDGQNVVIDTPVIDTAEESIETASLTQWDLERKISNACRDKLGKNKYGHISYWFPEEKTVWFVDYDRKSELDYLVFTYEVKDDEVEVSEPVSAKLTVAIKDVNTLIAEKDKSIGDLQAELEIKEDAIIKAGEKINALNVKIAELTPYKEAADKAEQERIENEIAEQKESLRNNMRKNNLFTEEEIASGEIAELIENRDETAIKTMIADRYIASFDKQNIMTETKADVDVSIASLETDDVEETPHSLMSSFLKGK